MSYAANRRQPVFVPLEDSTADVDLRAAWRRNDTSPALKAVLEEVISLDGATAA